MGMLWQKQRLAIVLRSICRDRECVKKRGVALITSFFLPLKHVAFLLSCILLSDNA